MSSHLSFYLANSIALFPFIFSSLSPKLYPNGLGPASGGQRTFTGKTFFLTVTFGNSRICCKSDLDATVKGMPKKKRKTRENKKKLAMLEKQGAVMEEKMKIIEELGATDKDCEMVLFFIPYLPSPCHSSDV